MKWGLFALALLVPGGLVWLIARTLRRRFAADHVSDAWLAAHDQGTSRIAYDSVCWDWPVNKRVNESAAWNTRQLRRRA